MLRFTVIDEFQQECDHNIHQLCSKTAVLDTRAGGFCRKMFKEFIVPRWRPTKALQHPNVKPKERKKKKRKELTYFLSGF